MTILEKYSSSNPEILAVNYTIRRISCDILRLKYLSRA